MVFYRRNYKSSGKRVKKGGRKPRRAARKGATKAFAKKVKSVIHKMAETKTQTFDSGFVAYNGGADTQADIRQLVPAIAQGTDNGQRLGDQITAQKLDIRGHFVLGFSYTGSSYQNETRLAVRMLIVTPKRYPIFSDAYSYSANWLGGVLLNGSSEQAMNGSVASMYLPVNKDTVTCHMDKLSYITVPFVSGATTSATIEMFHSTRFFKKLLPCRNKILRYNETNSSLPTNFGPVLLLAYAHLDGSSIDVVNTAISMQYISTLYYEDA